VPPTRPSANAGMKRTSVVEHNLYFAGRNNYNNNYNTSYNHYYSINLKPKVKTIAQKILAHTQMHNKY
jgi:hypothetical protein